MSRPAFQAGAQPEAGCQVGAGGDAGDRGSASLSYVVVMSAVLLLIALVLQSALWYHARNVAQAAAAEGLRATRLYDGTEGAGTQAATAFLRDAGGQHDGGPLIGGEGDRHHAAERRRTHADVDDDVVQSPVDARHDFGLAARGHRIVQSANDVLGRYR